MTDEQPTLDRRRNVRLNEPAPDFVARSTQGVLSLASFRGRWIILFSHPGDFTPVCTSEFIALEGAAEEFRELNCALVGLSADSLYTHLAWIADIERNFGIAISFPILEDISLHIAEDYGMIDTAATNLAALRSMFFIDPAGIIRAIIHYPANIGRSTDEVIRVLTALQASEKANLLAPVDWREGKPMLRPAPTTAQEVAERATDELWYYSEVAR